MKNTLGLVKIADHNLSIEQKNQPTDITAQAPIQQDFWQAIDNSKFSRNLSEDSRIQTLNKLPISRLIKVLEQYSYVTQIHAQSLECVVNAIKPGKLKELLTEIWWEETGNGDPSQSHYNLLKDFLFGLNQSQGGKMLENKIHPQIESLIKGYEQDLNTYSTHVTVGMAGMGTECICGPILEEIWAQTKVNQDLEHILPKLNLEFWEIHTGEVDHSHADRMRNAIDLEIADNPTSASQVLQGYQLSVKFWDDLLNLFVTLSL
ncbi:MAG: iron-containing redox enzyme family protein [Cyanobacteriota bacterium]|nr:iron-containing redox enzyme family protein [Cyanobacteriota bacterium]